MSAGRSTHQSLQRAVVILRTFTEQSPALTVGEISRLTDIHKSTVSRILSTLLDEGMVRYEADSSRYSLGVGLVELAGVALGQIDVRGAAMPYMEHLAHDVDETVALCVLRGSEAVTVAHASGRHSVRHVVWIGRRIPLHSTAAGKILLAPTATAPGSVSAELGAELDRIRSDDLATEIDEFEVGTTSIAVPIRDTSGAVTAALSIGAPTERFGLDRRATASDALRRTSRQIEWELGIRSSVIA